MRPTPALSALRLFSWAWWCIILHTAPGVCINEAALSASPTPGHVTSEHGQVPRAAFVSLVHESDLPAILTSICDLEATFNKQHQHEWVFFSTEPLGEEFRRRTSNATGATCLYEVIPREDWSVRGWAPGGGHTSSKGHEQDATLDGQDTSGLVYHWNLGSFAQQQRMMDYDWFWRVEPGVRFTHHIDFDVFRFMQDHGIAYGFSESALNRVDFETLSPQIKSFIDENPQLVHAEAGIAVLLNRLEREEAAQVSHYANDSPEAMETGVDIAPRSMFEGSAPHTFDPVADWSQFLSHHGSKASKTQEEVNDDTITLADSFATWLLDISDGSLGPMFELGSLAFLRSPGHQALMDHLEATSSAQPPCSLVGNVPAHSLSASIFLPKQSVWNFRKKTTRHAPWEPTQTASPENNDHQ